MKFIDSLIDRVTMYKLLIFYLGGLNAIAIGLSFFHKLNYKPLNILVSTVILVFSCWLINRIFASFFNASTNNESSIITALILALIVTPNPRGFGITFLLTVSGLAMASKYIITYRRKHIFNPAAIAITLTALGPHQSASWWIGTSVMMPFVLIGGVIITRKIQRNQMVYSFFASTLVATVIYSLISKANVVSSIHNLIFSSAVFFLGFVMLTEPLTSPSTKKKQTWYGVIVGFLLPPQAHLLNFYSSPEIALIIGNVFSYIVSPKTKLFPKLKEKIRIAPSSADFVFIPDRPLNYRPGQYMEWTLPHQKPDMRGERRYFTLASSPTEKDVRIGVKFSDNGSSFKEALLDMDQNTSIVASQIGGDFVMPDDNTQKLVFIAGGIGVTPFRSMIKYLIDTNDPRSVSLIYSARNESEFSYRQLFDQARNTIGLKTIYTVTDENKSITKSNIRRGFITDQLIKQEVPDYLNRIYYVSGTHQMVADIRSILLALGIARHRIKIDFFPGYK